MFILLNFRLLLNLSFIITNPFFASKCLQFHLNHKNQTFLYCSPALQTFCSSSLIIFLMFWVQWVQLEHDTLLSLQFVFPFLCNSYFTMYFTSPWIKHFVDFKTNETSNTLCHDIPRQHLILVCQCLFTCCIVWQWKMEHTETSNILVRIFTTDPHIDNRWPMLWDSNMSFCVTFAVLSKCDSCCSNSPVLSTIVAWDLLSSQIFHFLDFKK